MNKDNVVITSKDAVMIMCPTLADYKEAPIDQSPCEPFDCPKCKEKMWLSAKKKGVILFAALVEREVILACYNCITKMAEAGELPLLDAQQINL